MERIQQSWRHLSSREQLVVGGGAGVITLVMLIFYVWQPLEKARVRLLAQLPSMRMEAQQMRAQAVDVPRLKSIPRAQPLAGNLRQLTERFAVAHGLRVTQTNPEGNDSLNVILASASFDSWVKWLADLQTQQIQLESCRIEALPQQGMVKVQAIFSKG